MFGMHLSRTFIEFPCSGIGICHLVIWLLISLSCIHFMYAINHRFPLLFYVGYIITWYHKIIKCANCVTLYSNRPRHHPMWLCFIRLRPYFVVNSMDWIHSAQMMINASVCWNVFVWEGCCIVQSHNGASRTSRVRFRFVCWRPRLESAIFRFRSEIIIFNFKYSPN